MTIKVRKASTASSKSRLLHGHLVAGGHPRGGTSCHNEHQIVPGGTKVVPKMGKSGYKIRIGSIKPGHLVDKYDLPVLFTPICYEPFQFIEGFPSGQKGDGYFLTIFF